MAELPDHHYLYISYHMANQGSSTDLISEGLEDRGSVLAYLTPGDSVAPRPVFLRGHLVVSGEDFQSRNSVQLLSLDPHLILYIHYTSSLTKRQVLSRFLNTSLTIGDGVAWIPARPHLTPHASLDLTTLVVIWCLTARAELTQGNSTPC